MKITNTTSTTQIPFTRNNFPPGEFFTFSKELFIVLSWNKEGIATVLELGAGAVMRFMESKCFEYNKVNVQEIIYSIA